MKKLIKFIIKASFTIVLFFIIINLAEIFLSAPHIKKADKLKDDYDCVIVLGTSVKGNTPGIMLRDRLDTSIELIKSNKADIILMSGDGRSSYYNETKVMYEYAADSGVNSDIIYADPAGLSTYESVYRAIKLLDVKKPIIVTQRYHLFRAIFIARWLGADATGVACDNNEYGNYYYRHSREFFSRIKAFFYVIVNPYSDNINDIKIYLAEVYYDKKA
ncbi:MAG: YdcF family protein [Ruminococcus sp.]|nr:YdcF family protein [Ruminococcus sp.]